MSAQRFAKVPALVLDHLAAFSYRELRAYLACAHLANYREPRTVRASVGEIASTAGLQRSHTSEALRSLSAATDDRPAVIVYTPGRNQHTSATVLLIDGAACPDTGQADGAGCTETGHPAGHPTGQARNGSPAESGPLEPESQRKSSSEAEHIREAVRLLQGRSGAPITAEKVAEAIAKAAADAMPSEIMRAAEGVAGAEHVKSALALFGLKLGDVRSKRAHF